MEKKQLREEGHLRQHSVKRPFKKIAPEKLKDYVKNNPEVYLLQMFRSSSK